MKEVNTTIGKTYSVHTMNGCTIIEPDGWQKTIEAPDGYFDAHFGSVVIEGDDEASIKPLFKLAPQQRLAILGVLGGNAVGLPAGYKRVEWLESTGEQVIDTGLVMDSYNTRVKTKLVEIESEKYRDKTPVFLGYWSSNGGDVCYMLKRSHSYLTTQFNRDIGYRQARYELIEIDVSVTLQSVEIYVNGVLHPPDFVNHDFQLRNNSVNTVGIFGLVISEQLRPNIAARIYYVELYKDDAAIGHFVPCLDRTGAPCMFDLVSRQPFYNSGTGDLLYPAASSTYSLRRPVPDWGKLTEHGLRRLYHAPANYQGELYDYALGNGYKPIVETEQPAEGYWAPRWTETDDEIVLEWVETEPPDELGLPAEPLTNN